MDQPEMHSDTQDDGLLDRIMRFERLGAVFQPLFRTDDCELYGFEGLIRGPAESALHSPVRLFEAAERRGMRADLELLAARIIVREFLSRRLPGYLFLNLSCNALAAMSKRTEKALDLLAHSTLSPASLVVELTEHDRVADPDELVQGLKPLRDRGVRFALDDFGNGHSNLRLWMEMQPHVVKIDRFFLDGLSGDGNKFEIIRLLKRIAQTFNSELVAEGIERASDLAVIKDLGIPLCQGYLLARPAAEPERRPSDEAYSVLRSHRIAIQPRTRQTGERYSLVGEIVTTVPPVAPDLTNDRLARLFAAHPDYHAVAVVEDERPVGLINRRNFMDQYAQQYYRELYGRRPCTLFMQDHPLVVDRRTPLESLQTILTGSDQRYLHDGFIVTDNGCYVGLGTGESLVRAVTELRIEAARYANPLTSLPGNIPISEHIDRMLAADRPFVVCYADLNNFKPFNDQYGYWRGDVIIRLLASVLVKHANPQFDFVGHVGGDDFVVVFQTDGWEERCLRAINEVNDSVKEHYSKSDVEQDGFWGEDRQGGRCFFPLTTVSIGAVIANVGRFATSEAVASAAALAKRKAKQAGKGFVVLCDDDSICTSEEPERC